MPALTNVTDDVFIADAQSVIQQDINPLSVGLGVGAHIAGVPGPYAEDRQRRRRQRQRRRDADRADGGPAASPAASGVSHDPAGSTGRLAGGRRLSHKSAHPALFRSISRRGRHDRADQYQARPGADDCWSWRRQPQLRYRQFRHVCGDAEPARRHLDGPSAPDGVRRIYAFELCRGASSRWWSR